MNIARMADILVEAGELVPLYDNMYEDMGGHIISDTDVPSYFEYYWNHASVADKQEIESRLYEQR